MTVLFISEKIIDFKEQFIINKITFGKKKSLRIEYIVDSIT